MDKALLKKPRRSTLFHYTSTKRYFHAVKHCIAISPQLTSIARVFELTVPRGYDILTMDCGVCYVHPPLAYLMILSHDVQMTDTDCMITCGT